MVRNIYCACLFAGFEIIENELIATSESCKKLVFFIFLIENAEKYSAIKKKYIFAHYMQCFSSFFCIHFKDI